MNFDEAARLLQAAGLESPRAEARLLYAHALGMSTATGNSCRFREAQSHLRTIDALSGLWVTRRAAREPSAYITGRKWEFSPEAWISLLAPACWCRARKNRNPDRRGAQTDPGSQCAAEDCRSRERLRRHPDRRPQRISRCRRHWLRVVGRGLPLGQAECSQADAWACRNPPGGLGRGARSVRPDFLQPALHSHRCYQKFRAGSVPLRTPRCAGWRPGWA